MWKLHAPSPQLITWYKNKMLAGLCTRIKQVDKNGPLLEDRIQEILIPDNPDGSKNYTVLERLLTDKPVDLHTLCDNLMKQIIPGYNENEFENYLDAKRKEKDLMRNSNYIKSTLKLLTDCLKLLIIRDNYLQVRTVHMN